MERNERHAKQAKERFETENKRLVSQCETLEPKVKDLERQLRQALDDKTRFKMQSDRATDQLSDKQRLCDQLQQVTYSSAFLVMFD